MQKKRRKHNKLLLRKFPPISYKKLQVDYMYFTKSQVKTQ